MSRKTWVEVTCDGCGCCEQFLFPTTNRDIAEYGYIVEGNRHYCDQKCKDNADG